MANPVSVSTLITLARQHANMENSQFVTDPEILSLLERSNRYLYDLLIKAYQEYYLTSTIINVVSGTDAYALPDDFYKCQGVDVKIDQERSYTLLPYMFNERNMYQASSLAIAFGYNNVRYQLRAQDIVFRPLPNQSFTCVLWYIPVAKTLTVSLTPGPTETNTIDAINGYDQFLILDTAIQMLVKEESDASALMALKDKIESGIITSSSARDVGMAEHVVDLNTMNATFPFRSGYWF